MVRSWFVADSSARVAASSTAVAADARAWEARSLTSRAFPSDASALSTARTAAVTFGAARPFGIEPTG